VRSAAVLGLVAALACAGCGGSSDIDMGRIERQLKQQAADQAGVDRAAVKVQCPQRKAADPGTSFTCDVVIDHKRRTLTIALGDGGTYTATPSRTATVDAKQAP
jgi:hypothetical protein